MSKTESSPHLHRQLPSSIVVEDPGQRPLWVTDPPQWPPDEREGLDTHLTGKRRRTSDDDDHHPQPSRPLLASNGRSRRSFLKGLAVGAGLSVGAGAVISDEWSSQPVPVVGAARSSPIVPFRGVHQAGIATTPRTICTSPPSISRRTTPPTSLIYSDPGRRRRRISALP